MENRKVVTVARMQAEKGKSRGTGAYSHQKSRPFTRKNRGPGKQHIAHNQGGEEGIF